jgi:hypothetical protein
LLTSTNSGTNVTAPGTIRVIMTTRNSSRLPGIQQVAQHGEHGHDQAVGEELPEMQVGEPCSVVRQGRVLRTETRRVAQDLADGLQRTELALEGCPSWWSKVG